MERITIKQAKSIFKKNFIGPDELQFLFQKVNIKFTENIKIPEIPFQKKELEDFAQQDYILILGISNVGDIKLNIKTFRDYFGVDPNISEPCFYNQDWYLNESFIYETLDMRWYLLKKNVIENSRAVQPESLLSNKIVFPSAILCTYTFLSYFFANKEYLWYHDFIWCSDLDHNGDRIYVGKYHDIDGVNKNGFSIHRHLALRECYGAISLI